MLRLFHVLFIQVAAVCVRVSGIVCAVCACARVCARAHACVCVCARCWRSITGNKVSCSHRLWYEHTNNVAVCTKRRQLSRSPSVLCVSQIAIAGGTMHVHPCDRPVTVFPGISAVSMVGGRFSRGLICHRPWSHMWENAFYVWAGYSSMAYNFIFHSIWRFACKLSIWKLVYTFPPLIVHLYLFRPIHFFLIIFGSSQQRCGMQNDIILQTRNDGLGSWVGLFRIFLSKRLKKWTEMNSLISLLLL